MPTIAVSSYSFQRHIAKETATLQDTPRLAREIGADAIEFALGGTLSPAPTLEMCQRLGEACAAAEIPISGVCIAAELLQGDENRRTASRDDVIVQLEAVSILGITRFRHDASIGPDDGRLDDAAFDAALPVIADACRRIAIRAAELGIVSSVENHGLFVQHADRVRRLVEAVNHSAFRVTLDVGNSLFADQDHVEAARTLAPFASTVHVKDFIVGPQEDDGAWDTYAGGPKVLACAIGDGDADVAACARILREAHFDGPWVVEFEGPRGDPTAAARRGVEQMRAILGAPCN